MGVADAAVLRLLGILGTFIAVWFVLVIFGLHPSKAQLQALGLILSLILMTVLALYGQLGFSAGVILGSAVGFAAGRSGILTLLGSILRRYMRFRRD